MPKRLRQIARLRREAWPSACFSAVQGCVVAFFVTYLVVKLGRGFIAAGITFSIMQVTGVAGRVIAGWTADRVGSPPRC